MNRPSKPYGENDENDPLPVGFRSALTDGSDTVRPATLRGLSPDETLVLVDSKRQHASALVNINCTVGRGSAAVDLNTIPVAALDPIASVINLHLREARSGVRAILR
jgi:iron complex outermembrane receptor protein